MLPENAEDAVSVAHKVGDLGRYRLIAELARGGMGIVYLALVRGPAGFNKFFVVKVLKSHLAEDPKLVDMFLDEARLAAKLNHPNVVQTIEVGSDAGRHFIAMEFLDGQPLHRVLARTRRSGAKTPLQYQLTVLLQLLEGLHYAHEVTEFDGTPLNLVHRDVSPQNVFLTYDGQVKILDFGIAKALGSTNDTRTGVLKGKVAYMAPEQAAGESIDRRADVFAVGAMLWEAATGRRMWDRGLNDLQILNALVKGAIPRPRDVAPELDERIERIILKATSVEASNRYASAAEMQLDLDQCMRAMGTPGASLRDVGKFVADLFEEERAKIKGIIDGQLRILKGAVSGEYGALEMPRLSSLVPSSSTPSGVHAARDRDEGALRSLAGPAGGAPPLALASGARAPSRRRASRIVLWGGAVAAAALGVLLWMNELHVRSAPSDPALTTTAVSSAPPSSATAATLRAQEPSSPTPRAEPTAAPGVESSRASEANAPATPQRTPSPPSTPPRAQPAWAPRPVARSTASAAAGPTAAPAQADAPPAAAPAPASTPASTPTGTTHVRQQIDTGNPYNR